MTFDAAEPRPSFSSDPLIPHDFNAWGSNITAVLKRSGKRLIGALLIWSIVPAIVSVLTSVTLAARMDELTRTLPATPESGEYTGEELRVVLDALGTLGGLLALYIAVALVVAYFTSAGWAAALKIALTDAAGEPIPFADAMKYGARKGLAMWGWYALISVCVLVGLCMCFFPGLYLVIVFSLFAPVVVCEGGPAMARSLRLIHHSFGKMLGRVLLLLLIVILGSLVWTLLIGLIVPPVNDVLVVLSSVFEALASIAVAVVLVAGLLVTYAEARFREGSVTSVNQLVEESGR